jgi:hypothetical protein
MQAMLMTMNSTTAARLRMAPSWHRDGLMPVFAGTGCIASFQAIGRFRGGVGEQRKGSRVSASGEVV